MCKYCDENQTFVTRKEYNKLELQAKTLATENLALRAKLLIQAEKLSPEEKV